MDSNTLFNSAGGNSAALFILIVFLLALLATYWILASNKHYDREEKNREEGIYGRQGKSKKNKKRELKLGSVLGARDKRSEETATEERPGIVDIKNGVFVPSSLEIRTGTTVVWTNQDDFTHNIRSTVFNSPDLHTAESFSFRFENPGVYRYSCGIHPSMRGKITVLQ